MQNAAYAQVNADGFVDFAPGAQGGFTTSIPGLLDRAERDGQWLRDNIRPQDPAVTSLGSSIDELRERALNNPRVQALLGAGGQDAGQAGEDPRRYPNQRGFLFASFSMPEQSLRQMMIDAQQYNVPIVFRGFVNNSVFDTQVAIQRVFGDDAETIGFSIDPTLFTRFGITSVPQVVVTRDDLEPCETQACLNDIAPPHDKVAGNIPLPAVLEIIKRANGDSGNSAERMLNLVVPR